MVVPAAPARKVPQGGFDFFGAGSSLQSGEDLADVVGEELAAEVAAEVETEAEDGGNADDTGAPEASEGAEAPEAPEASEDAEREQQVIDLTAHDETEQIDMGELRSALQA